MRTSRRRFLGLAGASLMAAACPAVAAGTVRLGGPAFGSYWRITTGAGAVPQELRRRMTSIIAEVDARMSPYRSDSEIGRFNMLVRNDWMPVSRPTSLVLRAALRAAEESDGAFDPAVGPAVARYGFGPIAGASRASYNQLELSADAVRKHDPGLTIDLCGIAKGYALDQMASALDTADLDEYLIELGGEIVARGHHPSGRPWRVAIERPGPGAPEVFHAIELDGRAVATSGDGANSYEIAGRRYSHLIEPRTGTPVADALASVSVLAASGMEADARATALMVMGLERGAAFARDRGIDALFLVRDGDRFGTVTTGRFADRLVT